jgi:hypothetical protein
MKMSRGRGTERTAATVGILLGGGLLLVSRSFPGWDRLTGAVLGWLLVLIAVGPQYRWKRIAGPEAPGRVSLRGLALLSGSLIVVGFVVFACLSVVFRGHFPSLPDLAVVLMDAAAIFLIGAGVFEWMYRRPNRALNTEPQP